MIGAILYYTPPTLKVQACGRVQCNTDELASLLTVTSAPCQCPNDIVLCIVYIIRPCILSIRTSIHNCLFYTAYGKSPKIYVYETTHF